MLTERVATIGIGKTEADPILSYEAYEAVSRMYWVLGWKRGHKNARPEDWCFSVRQPLSVPNHDMHWRRPTYEEAVIRQERFLASLGSTERDDYWTEYVVKGAGRFPIPEAPYRRSRR